MENKHPFYRYISFWVCVVCLKITAPNLINTDMFDFMNERNKIGSKLHIGSVSKRTLKVGDTVEIIGNIPFQLKDKPKPLLGKITNIDGAYILVKPKYQRYECEFYSGELEYVC